MFNICFTFYEWSKIDWHFGNIHFKPFLGVFIVWWYSYATRSPFARVAPLKTLKSRILVQGLAAYCRRIAILFV